MPIEDWFLEQLPTIERAIGFVCHRYRLVDAEAEDFASTVKLKLIENDYAILRKYERRSSFASFIFVTVRRMLLDQRIHDWGKWHNSAEAKRLGAAAIELESLMHRDHRTLDECAVLISARHGLTRQQIDQLAERLPQRAPRARSVELDTVDLERAVPSDAIEKDAFVEDRRSLARKASEIVRAAVDELPADDRRLLRMRFFAGMSVADIARTLRLDQKMLYRRIDRCLRDVRARLETEGIRGGDVDDVLDGLPDDFAADLRNLAVRPSPIDEAAADGERARR